MNSIQKEREAFESTLKQIGKVDDSNFTVADDGSYEWDSIHFAWTIWQAAKAQAVPEGFVLVPAKNISAFYQDDAEPENFCTLEADLDNLGDSFDESEVMVVNKYTQAEISKEQFYGVWVLKDAPYGKFKKFELFKSYDEAKQAMIEAQEPAND